MYFFLIGITVADAKPNMDIESKVLDWKNLISKEIPEGTSKYVIFDFLERNKLKSQTTSVGKVIVTNLEEIETPNAECKSWSIIMVIHMNEQNISEKNRITSSGLCEEKEN